MDELKQIIEAAKAEAKAMGFGSVREALDHLERMEEGKAQHGKAEAYLHG